MDRKIRIGMVGGGKNAFIGGVHRIALRLDGYYELVAGSFLLILIIQKRLERISV